MYKVIFFLVFVIASNFSFAQSQETIDKALEKANLENKHVFLNYLSTSDTKSDELNNSEVKALLASYYVVVNVTLSESEITELVDSYNATSTSSNENSEKLTFPFWCILDEAGDILTASFTNDKNNIDHITNR